jgi:hypothetical protein
MSKEKITPNDEAVTGALATILKDSLLVSTKDFQSNPIHQNKNKAIRHRANFLTVVDHS